MVVRHDCVGQKDRSAQYLFFAVSLLGVTVRELISDSDRQAQGMKSVADRFNAAVSLMDLSVDTACARSVRNARTSLAATPTRR